MNTLKSPEEVAIELGKILKKDYENAKPKQQVISIYLFSIHFNNEIKYAGIKEVIEQSGIPNTYTSEVSKGVRLSQFVSINTESNPYKKIQVSLLKN
jgi:hypothetical protein